MQVTMMTIISKARDRQARGQRLGLAHLALNAPGRVKKSQGRV